MSLNPLIKISNENATKRRRWSTRNPKTLGFPGHRQSGQATQEFSSAFGAFNHIAKTEGVGGFFEGCGANNVRAIASALVLVLYDEAKKIV